VVLRLTEREYHVRITAAEITIEKESNAAKDKIPELSYSW